MTSGSKENVQDVSSVVQSAIERHGKTDEAIVPILSEVNDKLGYLRAEAMTEISQTLRVPESQLLATASFYRMLSITPRGEHVIQFCESAPCHVMGGGRILQALQKKLGIQIGETSSDGKWTLLAISCPGACGVGPVMMVDDEMYGNLTVERVSEILARYE